LRIAGSGAKGSSSSTKGEVVFQEFVDVRRIGYRMDFGVAFLVDGEG
jgi:hypothetical protein